MSVNHSVSDLASIIRNGYLAKRKTVKSSVSNLREDILKILKDEGYIISYAKLKEEGSTIDIFNISLKYHLNQPVISEIKVVSKPGRRIYCGSSDIPSIKNGLGLVIISTSTGVLPGYQAKVTKVGGEVLLKVFWLLAMSRIGKLPVKVPEGINVSVNDDIINLDSGKLKKTYQVRPSVKVTYNDNVIKLAAKDGFVSVSADVGMDRSNINNIVSGMEKPFEIVLEINGVGYRASVNQNIILLSLGFSHEIFYALPEGVTAVFQKPNLIVLTSSDKILVGQVAAEIIAFRKPEPYKGKGVKITGTKILRKEGKKK